MNDRNKENVIVSGEAENKAETIDNQVNNQKVEVEEKTPEYVKQEDFQAFMKEFLNKLLGAKNEQKEEVKNEEPKQEKRTIEDYTKW